MFYPILQYNKLLHCFSYGMFPFFVFFSWFFFFKQPVLKISLSLQIVYKVYKIDLSISYITAVTKP